MNEKKKLSCVPASQVGNKVLGARQSEVNFRGSAGSQLLTPNHHHSHCCFLTWLGLNQVSKEGDWNHPPISWESDAKQCLAVACSVLPELKKAVWLTIWLFKRWKQCLQLPNGLTGEFSFPITSWFQRTMWLVLARQCIIWQTSLETERCWTLICTDQKYVRTNAVDPNSCWRQYIFISYRVKDLQLGA